MLRTTHVRQHVNFMRARGFSTETVVAGSGIDAARLADPNYLIEAEQCHIVVSNLIRLSGDASIGLKIGAAIKLTDLGIVGYAMAASSTLGQAIGIWLQYGNSSGGFPFALKPLENPGRNLWGVSAAANGIGASIYRFYVEESLAMGMGVGSMLTGQPLDIAEIALSYPAPQHLPEYLRRFGCPLTFAAPATRVLVRSPGLDIPVTTNDSEMRELCIRHCSQLAQRFSRRGPVSSRLRSLLTSMGSIPSLDEAAAGMRMSPRSLRRHLQDEGTRFQWELDEFRIELAREYLGAGMMSAKEVAHLLGFSHVDAFRRAFKTWTGQTVGTFVKTKPAWRPLSSPEPPPQPRWQALTWH